MNIRTSPFPLWLALLILAWFIVPLPAHSRETDTTASLTPASAVTSSGLDTILTASADTVPATDTVIVPAADTIAQVEPIGSDTLYTIETRDGSRLIGYIVQQDDSVLTLDLSQGGTVRLPRSTVRQIRSGAPQEDTPEKQTAYQDPNRTRYLYAPSAHMLRQGEIVFSQKELFFSSLGFGVTDHFSLQAGAAIPFWFVRNGDGFNLALTAKAGGMVAQPLSLGGGLETIIIPGLNAVFGLPFATATLGNPDRHFSFNFSLPFALAEGNATFGELYWITISGAWRLTDRFSIVTDNWIFKLPELDDGGVQLYGLAGRILSKKLSADIGLFFTKELDFPLPWLDITYQIRGPSDRKKNR